MMFDQFISGRYDDMISTGLEKSGKYPDNLTIKYYLGWGYLFARNFDESYNWFKKAFDQVKAMGQTPNPDEAWGFVCLQKGMKEEADLYLNKPISNYERNAKFNYYAESNLPFLGLSWIYASKGDKEKALAYLKENKSFHSQAVNMVKYSPMLDNIRNEPEFAQILKNMEDKLKKEQKQISKLVNDFGGID
jgi:tetratricopeptide (TPR) repeat protein